MTSKSQVKSQSHGVGVWAVICSFWSIKNRNVGHNHGYVSMAANIWFHFRFPRLPRDMAPKELDHRPMFNLNLIHDDNQGFSW